MHHLIILITSLYVPFRRKKENHSFNFPSVIAVNGLVSERVNGVSNLFLQVIRSVTFYFNSAIRVF